MAKKKTEDTSRRFTNKKAFHQYLIHEKVEAGIVLTGSEVKSLRAGHAQLNEAFVRIHGDEAFLYNCQIDRYTPATDRNHEPLRKRKLLLHKREIRKLAPMVERPGTTLIPLSVFFNARGLAKVELGVATGKQLHDKRETLKKKDHQREIDRAMTRRR